MRRSVIAMVVAAALVTRNSKNGERARLIGQATSGRWLLTVGAMLAFLGLSLSVFILLVSSRHSIEPATAVALFSSILLVIQGVYKDYLRRSGDGDNNKPTEAVKPPEVGEVTNGKES